MEFDISCKSSAGVFFDSGSRISFEDAIEVFFVVVLNLNICREGVIRYADAAEA